MHLLNPRTKNCDDYLFIGIHPMTVLTRTGNRKPVPMLIGLLPVHTVWTTMESQWHLARDYSR